jgi:hypothetical protein
VALVAARRKVIMSFVSLLVPFVFLVLTGLGMAYSFWMRNQGLHASSSMPSYRAADLATKLRLQLVAGDPTFDYANPFSAKGRVPLGLIIGSQTTRVESALEGSPDGYPTRLSYLYQKDTAVESGLLSKSVRTKTLFQYRFMVRARRAFPAFEVISRAPTMAGGAIQREMGLPACSTGNAVVDAKY